MTNHRRFPVLLVLVYVGMLTGSAEAASIRLSWSDMSTNEDGFRIERKSSDSTYVQIASVGANVQSYTDSTPAAGVNYCYVVKAFNSTGVSAASSSACATASSSTSSGGSTGSGSGSSGGSGGSTGSTGGTGTTPSFYVGSKWKDHSITLSIKSLDNDAIGVIFRYLDDSNYYRFVWNRSARQQRIEKRHNGVLSILTQRTSEYQRGKTYPVQISARGDQLEVRVNNNLLLSAKDNSIDQGTIGLYSSSNKGSIFDDIVVRDLTSGQTLLSENFNDGDFTGWTILDDDGTTNAPSIWALSSGALAQTGNIGSTNNEIGTLALYTRGSWSDYTAAMKISSSDNDAIGVMFRYNDSDNYYRFSWNAETSSRRLDKVKNGVLTVLAEDSKAYVSGQVYGVKVSAKGSSLQVYIDGQQIFSVTDPTLASGSIALYSSNNAGSAFDDVLVQDTKTGLVLLWDDFNAGTSRGWTVIDEGDTDGPSQWVLSNGKLVQTSNIGSSKGYGTFALY